MLSYRHAFHAGNHADVLKHTVLCLILESLNRKEKPYAVIDTHAGAGIYSLSDSRLLKTGEAHEGVERLLAEDAAGRIPSDVGAVISAYLSLEKDYAAHGQYAGSPELSARMLRPHDSLILMELHSTEIKILTENARGDFSGSAALARAHIHHRNGFEGMAALVPPDARRGLVLCDPSYETGNDYADAAGSICAALHKWPQGIYALWYPLLAHRRSDCAMMRQRIICAAQSLRPSMEIADISLAVRQEDAGNAPRLLGSGMLVLNSPWKLREKMDIVLPYYQKLYS